MPCGFGDAPLRRCKIQVAPSAPESAGENGGAVTGSNRLKVFHCGLLPAGYSNHSRSKLMNGNLLWIHALAPTYPQQSGLGLLP